MSADTEHGFTVVLIDSLEGSEGDFVHVEAFESSDDLESGALGWAARVVQAAREIDRRDSVPSGCTGYRDEAGRLQHDGDTCPVHEAPQSAALEQGYRPLDGHDSLDPDDLEQRTCDVEGCEGWPMYADLSSGEWVCREHGPRRRYLVASFDITDLEPDAVDLLSGEVSVQAEATSPDEWQDLSTGETVRSAGKPDVPYPTIETREDTP